MTHYHVGSNIPGYSPDGEVLTFADLAAARTQLVASLASDRDAWDDRTVTITWDDDPEVRPGTSAWLTIGNDEFSRYYWAGRSDDSAGEPCECADGEWEVATAETAATRTPEGFGGTDPDDDDRPADCTYCSHPHDFHAFYPDQDTPGHSGLGTPAPLYFGKDCECEGYR